MVAELIVKHIAIDGAVLTAIAAPVLVLTLYINPRSALADCPEDVQDVLHLDARRSGDPRRGGDARLQGLAHARQGAHQDRVADAAGCGGAIGFGPDFSVLEGGHLCRR